MKNKMLSFFKITLVLSTILLISSSCTKDKWYSDTDIYSAEFEIFSNDWIFDSSDRSYYYDFKDGDLMIPNVVNNGAVQAAVLIDGTYRPLPYTNYFIENGVEYAETLNFEYNTGYIRFNVVATDQFYDATTKPRTYKIKVTTISYY